MVIHVPKRGCHLPGLIITSILATCCISANGQVRFMTQSDWGHDRDEESNQTVNQNDFMERISAFVGAALALLSFVLFFGIMFLACRIYVNKQRASQSLPFTISAHSLQGPRIVGAQRTGPNETVRPLVFVNRGYSCRRHFVADDPPPPSYEELFPASKP